MRWQRLSISECIKSGNWRTAAFRLVPSIGVTMSLLVVAALLVLVPPADPAEADEIVAGGSATRAADTFEGMPATNPRVKSLLAAHPGDFVTICVAGCGKPTIVQMLPKPLESRVGAMRTTAAGGPAQPAYEKADRDAVLCVAGCGAHNKVVQRLPGLPAAPKAVPKPKDPLRNEPLDR